MGHRLSVCCDEVVLLVTQIHVSRAEWAQYSLYQGKGPVGSPVLYEDLSVTNKLNRNFDEGKLLPEAGPQWTHSVHGASDKIGCKRRVVNTFQMRPSPAPSRTFGLQL
jgi:hypothetical protein